MGKIKNDFQHWMGQNHRDVLRGGNRLQIGLSEMGTLVEEYIQATATRLKAMEDAEKTGVLPTTTIDNTPTKNRPASVIPQDSIENYPDVYGASPLTESTPMQLTEEDFEKLKRALGMNH